MGIFNKIKYNITKNVIKGTCNSLLVAFKAVKSAALEGKIEVNYISDLVSEALSFRTMDWERVDKNTFICKRTRDKIIITKEDSLADVVLKVILIENKDIIVHADCPIDMFKSVINGFKEVFPEVEDNKIIRNPEYISMVILID